MNTCSNTPVVIQRSDQRQQIGGLHGVDLVEHAARPCAVVFFSPSTMASVSRAAGPFGLRGKIGGIDDQQHRIGIARAGPGGIDHGAVEPAARLEDARRIHEHDLRLAAHRDAAHRHARGLHLVADDGDLGADQRIDQRGFAGIRRADDGGKAARVFGIRRRLFILPAIPGVPASRARRPVRLRAWSRPRRFPAPRPPR